MPRFDQKAENITHSPLMSVDATGQSFFLPYFPENAATYLTGDFFYSGVEQVLRAPFHEGVSH